MRDFNKNRCTKRLPGPSEGTRCIFDCLPGRDVCAGHAESDTWDREAYNAWQASAPKPKPKPSRKPRRVKR